MNATTERATTAPATPTLAEPTVLAMLARGGWITKTARGSQLPDPLFVISDRFDLTFQFASYDDLVAWAAWADLRIETSRDTTGNTHHLADGALWEIPLRLVFIDRSTATIPAVA